MGKNSEIINRGQICKQILCYIDLIFMILRLVDIYKKKRLINLYMLQLQLIKQINACMQLE